MGTGDLHETSTTSLCRPIDAQFENGGPLITPETTLTIDTEATPNMDASSSQSQGTLSFSSPSINF